MKILLNKHQAYAHRKASMRDHYVVNIIFFSLSGREKQ